MAKRKRGRRIKKGRILILIGFISALMFISYNAFKNKESDLAELKVDETKIESANNTSKPVSVADAEKVLEKSQVVKAPEPEKATEEVKLQAKLEGSKLNSTKFETLKIELEDMCKSNGEWSIYVKDLKTGERLSINNKKMVAASVIKLFIMARTYEGINSGTVEETKEVTEMLNKMITISHNESSNRLVEILGDGSHKNGMNVVNKYALSINCMNTEQQRDMKDSRPVPVNGENYTSTEDCAKLLEKIYNKQCVSLEFDKKMMDLMLAQQRNTKIPALIPKGTKIAHKTGELAQTENDVGIVFGPKTDYIICVMSKELKNSDEARKRISNISKVVYDFFK